MSSLSATEISQRREMAVAKWKEMDAVELALIYHENAVAIPPDMAPITTRNEIKKFFEKSFVNEAAVADAEQMWLKSEQLIVINDRWAVDYGQIQWNNLSGYYVEVWHKDGELWYIYRDIWTSIK